MQTRDRAAQTRDLITRLERRRLCAALVGVTLATTLACDDDGPLLPTVPELTGHWRVVEVTVNRERLGDERREGPAFDFALTREVATVSFGGDGTVVVLNDMGLGLRHRTDATYEVGDTLAIDGRAYTAKLTETELSLSHPGAFARLIRVASAPDPDAWVETWTSAFATGTPDGARGDIAATADGGMWVTGGESWDLIHLAFPLEPDAEVDVVDLAPDAVAVGGNTPWCNDRGTNSLFVVDPGTGEPSSPRGSFDAPIDAIARDNSGNLWCVAAEEGSSTTSTTSSASSRRRSISAHSPTSRARQRWRMSCGWPPTAS